MDTFREMCDALLTGDTSNKPEFDSESGVLTVRFSEDNLYVSELDGKAHFEVRQDDRSAALDMEYDKACSVLQDILNGKASINARFPKKPRVGEKTKNALRKVFGIIAGTIIALLCGFCTLALAVYAFTDSVYSDDFLFNVGLVVFFAILTAAGVCLAHFGRKGKVTLGKAFGVGGSLLVALIPAFLIFGFWTTYDQEPTVPIGGNLALTAVMLPFVAGGIALMVSAIKMEPDEKIFWQPSIAVVPSAEVIEKIRTAAAERTARKAIGFTLDYDAKPTLFSSKVGGVPYWDMSRPYPNVDGRKLMLLAQFNLSELPENDIFPREGMLQFFVNEECEYECNEEATVVYHRTIDSSVTEDAVMALGIITSLTDDETVSFPVTGQMGMKFALKTVSMTCADARFGGIVSEIAAELGMETYGCDHLFSPETDDADHWLTGYPFFAQFDPRSEELLKKYDTMLMQLSSEENYRGDGRGIIWGDYGVANFFINSEALRKMEFDDVYFTWDCY